MLQNRLALTIKNSSEHQDNSLTLTVHGLIFGRIYYWKNFGSEIWGLIFGRAYFCRGLLLDFYGTFAEQLIYV